MADTLIIGAGQIGLPLAEVLGLTHNVHTRDNADFPGLQGSYNWLHICFPYSETFIEQVVAYTDLYDPAYLIIHSTVLPGTTDKIARQLRHSRAIVAYSPVRGRHHHMIPDLLRYTKYIASPHESVDIDLLKEYLETAHFTVQIVKSVTALETAKLIETSYTALLIAWAQEMERIARKLDVPRLDLLELTKEVEYLPDWAFQPGYIGGHCLIPNLELLREVKDSMLLLGVLMSNDIAKEWKDEIRRRPSKL